MFVEGRIKEGERENGFNGFWEVCPPAEGEFMTFQKGTTLR